LPPLDMHRALVALFAVQTARRFATEPTITLLNEHCAALTTSS
jgi:hypothetical protein